MSLERANFSAALTKEPLPSRGGPAPDAQKLHEERETGLTIESVSVRAKVITVLLDEMLHRPESFPYRHWGINE